MATASGNFYGEYSKQSRLRLYWEYTQDTANNCDYFYLELYAQKPSGTGTHSNNYNNSIYWLTGFSENALINDTGNYTWADNTELFIGKSSFTNKHNDNGVSGDVSLNGSWITNLTSSSVVGERMEVAGTVTGIPAIPRYAILTHSLNSKTTNSIKVNWSSNSSCDRVEYKIGSGSWVTASTSSAKSGLYTISNLKPNTTYKISTRVRSADSQLYTVSSVLSVTTYDIARITNAPDFNLGESVSITYTNPSNSNIQIGIYSDSTDSKGYAIHRKCSGNKYTFDFSDTELDNIYKALGNNNYVDVSISLVTFVGSTIYRDHKTVRITLTGNQKTGHINIDEVWKRTKRWVNVKGIWKRCVRWVNVNGTWKRCI